MRIFKGVIGNRGSAKGDAVVIRDSISWWGGVNFHNGSISELWLESRGTVFAGKIFVLPSTKGSSGNWSILVHSARLGTHPKAIVMQKGDPLIVAAAFNIGIPYVFGFTEDLTRIIRDGDHVIVNGDAGEVIVEEGKD